MTNLCTMKVEKSEDDEPCTMKVEESEDGEPMHDEGRRIREWWARADACREGGIVP
ncbi:hypothetical protein QPK24_00920 [Paenibacillus polygoni]|uniref:Uncharacterized protein n=1 Tax=Paenibacillus polygoni TaxID=3050112 RepID=A0ABY8X2X6_9BACL|nr:hypothetical protein [Paenibacillus polygoni]WIV19393.1 hypothetical protein QPK24_00920 [Paenibacillus polygoni]